jgi:hypothetical protein
MSADRKASVPGSEKEPLTAVYYPFSRCLDEETLKRAILLYDRVVFVDPKTPKVRQGLYSVENHQPYLPDDAALKLAKEWEYVEQHYDLLGKERAISFLDPTQIIERPAVDQLMTENLQKDMGDKGVLQLFSSYPDRWSMLRSRIPQTSFKNLSHQYTPRVLYEENTRRPFASYGNEHYALIADGKPYQEMSMPGEVLPQYVDYGVTGSRPVVEEEYACVVPYYLGSSLAVSLMLAVSSDTGAIPFTDSNAHHKLLSIRFQRAAMAQASVPYSEIPGLTKKEQPESAQKWRMVEMRLVDSILSTEDLQRISLEDCLEYRKHTEKQRQAFISLLSDLTKRTRHDAWSPEIEQELQGEIKEIQDAVDEQKASLRNAYTELFKKTAIGIGISAAPILLTAVFPAVSVPIAFMLGAGPAAGFLVDPLKELATLWANNLKQQNSLAYILNLEKEVSQH